MPRISTVREDEKTTMRIERGRMYLVGSDRRKHNRNLDTSFFLPGEKQLKYNRKLKALQPKLSGKRIKKCSLCVSSLTRQMAFNKNNLSTLSARE